MSSNQNAQVPDIKYKTELCKTWVEQNFCPYMEKCRFAHGKTDLQDKIIFGKNYKQKDCKSFHTQGFCPYGPRCLFRHDERKFSELNRPFYKYALENTFISLFFGKNTNKRKASEDDFLNTNIDISETLKSASNTINYIGISNLNLNLNNNFNSNNTNNSSFCFSRKNSELDGSQVFPSKGLCQRIKFYTPHLNIFKKIHHNDMFSFDSTDVDIECENSDCNLNVNEIGNYNKSSLDILGNFNISPKITSNSGGFNGISSYPNNSKANSNLLIGFGGNRNGNSANKKNILENNINLNTTNHNNNLEFNSHKKIPYFCNNGNNNKIIGNSIYNKVYNNNLPNNAYSKNMNKAIRSNPNSNSNINNFIWGNNENSNNILKNINILPKQTSNFNINNLNYGCNNNNNNNQKPSLNSFQNSIAINSNKINNFNSDNNESFTNTENINPNIKSNLSERDFIKENNNANRHYENDCNINNRDYISKTFFSNKHLSQNNFLNNNYHDNYNKIFENYHNSSNNAFLSGCDSPDHSANLTNTSILTTENCRNYKEESGVPNTLFHDFESFKYFNNCKERNFKKNINNNNRNNNYDEIKNNKNKDKIDKETIFVNFSKITENNSLKNKQNLFLKANKNSQYDFFQKNKSHTSFDNSNNIDELMKINPVNNSIITNKAINTQKLSDDNSKIIKENETLCFLGGGNNSNNINFYSIY